MISKKFKTPVQSFPKNSRVVFQDDYISAKTIPNNLPYNRVGILVSKYVSKKAVERNKIKRIIFNSLKPSTTPTHKQKNKSIDLLIITKPSIINLTKKELENRLKIYGRTIYRGIT